MATRRELERRIRELEERNDELEEALATIGDSVKTALPDSEEEHDGDSYDDGEEE
jgi:hypothetical protein